MDAFAKDLHLGNLIFGDEFSTRYERSPGNPNALSHFFKNQGISQIIIQSRLKSFSFELVVGLQPTFLKPNHYLTLFVEFGRRNWCHCETYTYRTPTKQVWSITPNFPENFISHQKLLEC